MKIEFDIFNRELTESMDSDDQQFHHYQKNEQPHLLITVLTERKKRRQLMTLEIQVLIWDMYKDVAGCVGLWTTGYLDNRCYRELRSYLLHME
jgi:hypothetical protein